MILGRDQILAADDLKREQVEVPEWGGTVIVAALSGTQRDAWEASIVTSEGRPNLRNMRAKLVSVSVVDEAGQQIFSAADVEALGAKSAAALERVAKVAQRLSKLGNEQLEELRGN